MLERVRKAAQEAEGALSSSQFLEINAIDSLVMQFQNELHIEKTRAEMLGTSEDPALVDLTQRLYNCKKQLGILRLSGGQRGQSENVYLKQREELGAGEKTDYYERNSEKLKGYIKIASHSISSIDKQRSFLLKSRKKLEDGLEYLGMSDRVVDQISNRYLTDYRIFQSLVVLFLLLFVYIVFVRK